MLAPDCTRPLEVRSRPTDARTRRSPIHVQRLPHVPGICNLHEIIYAISDVRIHGLSECHLGKLINGHPGDGPSVVVEDDDIVP